MDASQEDELITKPKVKIGNAFLRQELKSLTPICNLKCALICNSVLTGCFLMFGLIVLLSSDITEIITDYTNW
jgi:hypothetical protein